MDKMDNTVKDAVDKQRLVESLKQDLVHILKQLNGVAPLKFHDTDCDDCLYNYKDVVYDAEMDSVHIELAMWDNSLSDNTEKGDE